MSLFHFNPLRSYFDSAHTMPKFLFFSWQRFNCKVHVFNLIEYPFFLKKMCKTQSLLTAEFICNKNLKPLIFDGKQAEMVYFQPPLNLEVWEEKMHVEEIIEWPCGI